jgi:hypothetical protein
MASPGWPDWRREFEFESAKLRSAGARSRAFVPAARPGQRERADAALTTSGPPSAPGTRPVPPPKSRLTGRAQRRVRLLPVAVELAVQLYTAD